MDQAESPLVLTPYTLKSFAALVAQLRTIQKASGSGYKTAAAGTSAKTLETQVDAAIKTIERHHGRDTAQS
jgi:hypothetical protein